MLRSCGLTCLRHGAKIAAVVPAKVLFRHAVDVLVVADIGQKVTHVAPAAFVAAAVLVLVISYTFEREKKA